MSSMHTTIFRFIALTIVMFITTELLYAQLSGYEYRKKFSVDNTKVNGAGSLTNFPVLISLTDSDLATTANGGKVTNSNGYDIAFTSSDGTTQLDHELEEYSAATGEILFWVRFPTLSATVDTDFFIYFGNSSQSIDQSVSTTWDNNYQLVLHLDDFEDATSNNNDGTNNGTTGTTGKIGNARQFSTAGADDFISVTDDASLDISGNITLSAWININNFGDTPDLITKGDYTDAYSTWIRSNGTLRFATQNNTLTSGSTISSGSLAYVSFTKSNSGRTIYINGNAAGSDGNTTNFDTNTSPLYISTSSYGLNGMVDEVRVSNIARSADWIATEYENQNTPNSFYVENEEKPVLSNIEVNPQSFNAGGSEVFITSNITITTPFLDSLESASIQISSNYLSSEDVLAYVDTPEITGSWSSGTGILTLTGRASLADYQTALRSVTYENTNAGSPNQNTRTVSFTVQDAFYTSDATTRDINIITTLTDLSTDFANTVFHFDAQDIDGDLLTNDQPADGSSVSAWGDRSLNAGGSSATIITSNSGGDEPIFDSDYFGERGGLFFDYNSGNNGDNFQLTNNNILNTSSFTQKSFAAVFRTNSDVTGLQIIYEQGGGSNGYQISIKDGNAYAYAWSTNGGWVDGDDQSINLGTVEENTTYIVVATHNASSNSWKANINNSPILQSAGAASTMNSHGGSGAIGEENGTNDPVDFTSPGTTNNFDGYIAELVSWNTSFNGGQMSSVYEFLCEKWCNTAPVLANIEGTNLDFTEGNSPKTITSTITTADIDNTVLMGATVTIADNYTSTEDVLAFVDAGGITGSWSSGLGVLTLTGSASKAQYQTALRSITYQNTNTVNPNTSLRRIDFRAIDWDDTSSVVSRNVNIIAINSSPTLAGISGPTLSYNEGDGALSGGFPVVITDVDDVNMESATIAITNNYFLGEDELNFVSASGITGSWDSFTGILTLTGSATKAAYQTALGNVTYENLSSDPVELTRTFAFTVNDGDNNSNTQTRDLTVTATNSAPILTDLSTSVPSYTGTDLIITNTIEVSDPDDTVLDSAIVVISDNLNNTEDSLIYSTIFGITGTFDLANGRLKLVGTASFSDYQIALRSVKYRNFGTVPTGPAREIAFIASDGSLKSDSLKKEIEVNPVEAISGLEVWLRADVGVITSGTQVTTWEDQSGNNNDFIGRTGSGTRPTYIASSTPLGNQPAINFVGNGDAFEDPDGDTNYLNGLTEFTLMIVYKSDQTSTDRGLWNAIDPNGADEVLGIRYDASGANSGGAFTNVIKTGILGNNSANQLESFSDIQTTNSQITSLHWKSNTLFDIYVDGILNNPSSAGPPPTGTISSASTAWVGRGGKDTGNSSWDGQIAEVILYSKDLTTLERQKIEDYLSLKYNSSIRKISPANGGGNISADDANTSYTSLTGPVVQEGFPGDFSNGGTFVLKAPIGFEWNTGGTYTVTEAPAYGGSTTLNAAFTSVTASQITYTISAASTTNPGQLTFGGLQVRPTTGTLPNTGNITNIGTTGQGGATNYGTLVMVPGAVDSLTFIQQPSITNVDSTITPFIRVQLVDQFGNNVETSGTNISLSKATGAGTLSVTSPVATNSLGIAQFNNAKLDATGTHTLTASSSGLNSETSNAFDVVSTGVLVGFRVERSPSGNISSKYAGQTFNTVITAIDGTGATVVGFTGKVVITSTCTLNSGQGTTANFTAGVLSPHTVSISNVGNCSIKAKNNAGPEFGNSNTFNVTAGPASATKTKITASPTVILNDAVSTSTITVQAKDAFGNNLTTGGATIVLSATQGTLSSVTDNSNGTYTATLTSSVSVTTSTITGTLNGNSITDNATVEFVSFSHIWVSQLGSPAVASNWDDGGNWNVGTVPTTSSTVLVPADPADGNEYPVIDQANTTIETLTLESGSQATVSGIINFIVTGDITGGGEILGSNDDSLTIGGNLNVSDISLGNVILNGSSDQTITSPNTLVNVEIDNPGTVSITDNFTTTGTLTLTDGELLIPSDVNLISNSTSYTAGNLRFQRIISGVKGWRIISSPVNSTYGDFLDGTLTQGYTGSTLGNAPLDSLQPNILTYEENYPGTDNQRYRAPTSSSQALTQGQGVLVYFFGSVAADNRYNNPLPDTLDVTGQEFNGNGTQVDFGVTYTTAADSGWNLIGNPFGATINWDDSPNWTKTNIESTIYVWDPAANAGNGEYLTWNGTTGTLGSGLIAPFQGFWIKANAVSPSLIVKKAAKTTGGNFVRKVAPNFSPVLELTASTKNLSKRTNFMFSNDGNTQRDAKDGARLVPFSTSHIEFFSILDDGTQLAINNLPKNFTNRIRIPINLRAFYDSEPVSEDFTISLSGQKGIPEDWLIYLIDAETGDVIDLKETDYTFFYGTKGKISVNTTVLKPQITNKSNSKNTRFTLQITTEEIEANIPEQVYLNQNYPNPFNPETTIPFGIDIDSNVKLVVYDILGRKVATLVDKNLSAGNYNQPFKAQHLASGVYFYRLSTAQGVFVKKLTLIK